MSKTILFSLVASILGLAYSLFEIIFIERKEEKEKKSDKLAKAAYKGANRFINKTNFSLIIFVLAFGAFFAGSNIGIKYALAFVLGAAIAYAVGRISLISLNALNARVLGSGLENNEDFSALIKMAGVVTATAASLAILILAISYQFVGDIRIVFPFAMGALVAAIFIRISGGILSRSVKSSDSEIVKNICGNSADIFGGTASFFGYSIIALSSAAIAGFLISPADSRIIFLPLSLALLAFLIIFANVIAARFAKKHNINNFFKVSLWISAAAELLAAFFIINRITGISEFFWALSLGVVLSLTLEAARDKFKGSFGRAIYLSLIYFAFALSFKIGGAYAMALTALGAFSLLAISFIKNIYFSFAENSIASSKLARETGEGNKSESKLDKILFELSEIFAIVFFIMLIKFILLEKMLNLPLSNLIASRTVFGLILGGLAAILAYAAAKESSAKIVKLTEKDIANVEFENNYKRYAKIVSAISSTGALAVISVIIILPVAIALIFGLHAFAAFLAGLAASSFSLVILENGDRYSTEIIEAVALLLLLSIVLLPAIV